MIARDVMTRDVLSVTPDTPVRKIASLLVKHGIGAVPVIDSSGALIGIVSEGDLIRPDRAAREAWRQSWLEILAEGEPLAPELLAWLGSQNRSAPAVMSAPVITVSEETNLREIAEILTTRRIKRVPVVTDGRIVGIISCADLVRALSVSLNKSVAEARAR
jgi:CBS-domain-containing membrane protein